MTLGIGESLDGDVRSIDRASSSRLFLLMSPEGAGWFSVGGDGESGGRAVREARQSGGDSTAGGDCEHGDARRAAGDGLRGNEGNDECLNDE